MPQDSKQPDVNDRAREANARARGTQNEGQADPQQETFNKMQEELTALGKINKDLANDNKKFHTDSIDSYVDLFNSIQSLENGMPDDASPMLKTQMETLAGIMVDNQTASVRDQAKSREKIDSVITVLDTVVEKSETQEKILAMARQARAATDSNTKVYNRIGEKITDHLVDGFGALTAATMDSPFIAMTAKFFGDKFRERKDKKLQHLNEVRNAVIERQSELLEKINTNTKSEGGGTASGDDEEEGGDTLQGYGGLSLSEVGASNVDGGDFTTDIIPPELISEIHGEIQAGAFDEQAFIEGFQQGIREEMGSLGADKEDMAEFIEFSTDELKGIIEQIKAGSTQTAEVSAPSAPLPAVEAPTPVAPPVEQGQVIDTPRLTEVGEEASVLNNEILKQIEVNTGSAAASLDKFLDSSEENRREQNAFQKKLLKVKNGKAGKNGGAGAAGAGSGDGSIWDSLGSGLLGGIGGFAAGLVGSFTTMLAGVAVGAKKLFTKVIPKFVAKLALLPITIGLALLNGFYEAFRTWQISGSIGDAVVSFGGGILEFFTLGLFGEETLRSIGGWLGEAVFNLVQGFKEWFGDLWGKFKEVLAQGWDAIKGMGEWIYDNTIGYYVEGIKAIFSFFGVDIESIITDAWDDMLGVLSSAGNLFQDYVIDPIAQFFQNITDFFKEIWGDIADFDFSTLVPEWLSGFLGMGESEGDSRDDIKRMVHGIKEPAISKKNERSAVSVAERLESRGIVDLDIMGNSEIDDWKQVGKLSLDDIKALYAYKDWSEADALRMARIIQQKEQKLKSGSTGTSTVTPVEGVKGLLQEISEGEGTSGASGYNTEFDYGKHSNADKPLSEMTMTEVKAHQKEMLRTQYANGVAKGTGSSAVGKYQFISSTLQNTQDSMGISDDTVFSPEIQDQMGEYLLRNQGGLNEYENSDKSEAAQAKFVNDMASQWASIAEYGTNESRYGQSVGTTNDELAAVIPVSFTTSEDLTPGANLEPLDNSGSVIDAIKDSESSITSAGVSNEIHKEETNRAAHDAQRKATTGVTVNNNSSLSTGRSNDTKSVFDEDRTFTRMSDRQYAF